MSKLYELGFSVSEVVSLRTTLKDKVRKLEEDIAETIDKIHDPEIENNIDYKNALKDNMKYMRETRVDLKNILNKVY